LLFVAHAIDQYQDYSNVDLKQLASQRLQMTSPVEGIVRRLKSTKLPADLLLVAACDSFPTERVRRRKQIKPKELAYYVSRETGMEKVEAERLIEEDPEAEWLESYRSFVPTKKTLIAPSRFKQCPSHIFPALSRRMISYWRSHRNYRTAKTMVSCGRFQ
jgi:hypothetical protein